MLIDRLNPGEGFILKSYGRHLIFSFIGCDASI